MGDGCEYQATTEAGTQDTKGKAPPSDKPVRYKGAQWCPPRQAQACRPHNPIEEIEVPPSGCHAAEGYSTSHDDRPGWHNKSWPVPIHEATCHWCHHAIDDDGNREHQGGIAPRPSKFLHDGGVENREGVPDGIAKHQRDKGDGENDPAIEDAVSFCQAVF